MNRTSLTSRVLKLEATSRSSRRQPIIFLRLDQNGDTDERIRERSRAEFDRRLAAMIEAGEALPGDEPLEILTVYLDPLDPPFKPASQRVEEALVERTTPTFDQMERQLAAMERHAAPPAAERQQDASDRGDRFRRGHAALLAASPAHPPVGH